MPLGPGQVFAGYTIVRLLGSGGMGEVYLAQHPRLPRRDALKILPANVSADPEFRNRFTREADLAASLFHPHIVGVHDRGEFDGHLWITMDYIEGVDAGQLVKRQYPNGVPATEVAAIVTAVAAALDYAHQRRLLHRDVKPANILIAEPDDDGSRRIFLADFGIARQLGDISGLTATNLTVGTVSYAAPEQLMGAAVDGRADQYALAATAFHLLTGRPPFQNSNPVAVISQHLNAPPPQIGHRRPDLARFDHVLSTALAKNPADRFARCRDFAAAFNAPNTNPAAVEYPTQARPTVAAHVPAPAPVGGYGPPPFMGPPRRRAPRRRSLIVAAVATLVVAIGAAAAVYTVTRSHHPTSPPVAMATLDGTYRLDYDTHKTLANGAPDTTGANNVTLWWAFRSACTPAECVATGTRLDEDNHQVANTKVAAHQVLRFADHKWQAQPHQDVVPQRQCISPTTTDVIPGQQTEHFDEVWEPKPDGTLTGTTTITILTNECGNQGTLGQAQFVATRTADAPPSVTIADPATVPAAPPPTTPAPLVTGPSLNGTYRLDYDNANTTANGTPVNSSNAAETHWWAFQSRCTAQGCVATGSSLNDNDHQQPAGDGRVLRYTDGHWEDMPYLGTHFACAGDDKTADSEAISWSLTPQSDDTLNGTVTQLVLTNECGNKGTVWRTPVTVTREGDAPSDVPIADPALF
jgi:serine/threonine protein kinase, bacterial